MYLESPETFQIVKNAQNFFVRDRAALILNGVRGTAAPRTEPRHCRRRGRRRGRRRRHSRSRSRGRAAF